MIRRALTPLVVLAVCVSGAGLLYLLRNVGPLGFGPHLAGALPLQQLAGGASQPLGRVMAAWLPAGVVAGVVLGELTRLSVSARAIVGALGSALVLLAAGAVADAVAISDPVGPHVVDQLGRSGIWVAVACVTASILLTRGLVPE